MCHCVYCVVFSGDQVLAQFSQDGQWYRAEVIEVNDVTPVSPATVRVLYTDYGNKELTTMDRYHIMSIALFKGS